jgi:hypothetical protein
LRRWRDGSSCCLRWRSRSPRLSAAKPPHFAACWLGCEPGTARGSLGRCRDLVTGHAWRVALLGTLLVVCGTGLGPLLGVVWLLVAQPPLALVNALSAVASAITVPFVAVSLALLYFDLAARHDDEQSAEDRASSPRPPGSEYGPLQNTKGMP